MAPGIAFQVKETLPAPVEALSVCVRITGARQAELTGVDVGNPRLGVFVGVAVFVGVLVGVCVAVSVDVCVGEGDSVGDAVGVLVGVAVCEGDAVGDTVGVPVCVAVGVAVSAGMMAGTAVGASSRSLLSMRPICRSKDALSSGEIRPRCLAF